MNNEALNEKLSSNTDLQNKCAILKLATKLNPAFKNPNIIGGYLRDIALDKVPSDCDVVFEGYMKDQPGILECVKEAEHELGFSPYENWEFENFKASEVTGDIFEDTIGFYSNHTDFLTLILCDINGNLRIGSDKTSQYLSEKVYDIRYQGLMVWMAARSRSYFRSLAGVACRGIYLSHKLDLNPTKEAIALFEHFDLNFEKLSAEEKTSLTSYWNKKTKSLKNMDSTLRKYKISSLNALN